MISVSVSHGDTCVNVDHDGDDYAPDIVDDLCKHATRALYAAHCWLTGQAQPRP